MGGHVLWWSVVSPYIEQREIALTNEGMADEICNSENPTSESGIDLRP